MLHTEKEKTGWLYAYRIVGSVSVYPCNLMADWKWHFAAVHEPGKRSKFKIGSTGSTECISLSLHCKVEKS